jgi:hypothetical protein
MLPQTELIGLSELMEQTRGATIMDGGYSDGEGMHFALEDGRYIIIYGNFVVSLCRVSKESLQ